MAYLQSIQIDRVTPETLPISLQEVKDYLRVDFSDDDSLIELCIRAAIDSIERYSGRILQKSGCKAYYFQNGGDKVALYYADNIELNTGSTYEVKGGAIYTEDTDIEIEYTAGYENDALPFWAKQAILSNVAYRYENRGDVGMSATQIDNNTKDILAPHVKWSMI